MKKIFLILVLFIPGSPAFSQKETVSWNTGEKIVGEIHFPKGAGPFPAVLVIGGSGSLSKEAPVFQAHADKISDMGLAVLVYDKRGTGKSSGSWKDADFYELASDALGGFELLQNHPKIDKDRIGILGISQGFWVGLILDSLKSSTAFMIMNSPAPMTPAEQNQFIIENQLKSKGYPDSIVEKAVYLNTKIEQVYRTNNEWEKVSDELALYQTQGWYNDAGLGLQSKDSWNWKWYATLMDFNPDPFLKRIDCPMIAMHGENDPIMPASRCAAILDSIAQSNHKDVTNIIVKNSVHTVQTGKNKWPDEYWDSLLNWLKKKDVVK